MSRSAPLLAALVVLAALPAAAQDSGGVRLGGAGSVLGAINARSPGCPLSRTNVLVGVNRALSPDAQANQSLSSVNTGCRPLVSAQVVGGVNLGLAAGSQAGQSLTASSPRGLLATENVARGFNLAVGSRSAAVQSILSHTGR